jgi:hypothetical protein
MQRGIWILPFMVWLGATSALAQSAEPRRWNGVKGAEPSSLQAPAGCFLYRDYVVLEKAREELGNDIVVKDRRKYGAKATPAQLCADDGQHVLLKRLAQENDFFAGIYQGFLLVDSGTGAQRSLILQPLAGGKKAAEFTYYSEFPVRALGTSLYWFDTPALQSTKCETRFFKSGVPKAQCRKHADVLWQCVQQEAAPRLDATPNPFSHPGAFDEGTSTDECQLLVMEQRRLDLGNLSITPTGHVWGRGYFTAVE